MQMNDLITEANENIESILEELGFDTAVGINTIDEIRLPCAIHGGDNPTAFKYDKNYMNWKCFSHNCHKNRNQSIIGIIQASFANKNKILTEKEATDWLASFLNIDNYKYRYADSDVLYLNNRHRRKILNKNKEQNKFKPISLSSVINDIKPSEYFLKNNIPLDIVKKFYLGDCYTKGKPMYNRAFAPILDYDQKMIIGITGRTIIPKCDVCGLHHLSNMGCPSDNKKVIPIPKWKHYGFSASANLYNIWNAKEHINKTKTAIITEGPKDVWRLEENGIHNSVSIFGLVLSKLQKIALFKENTINLLVALDHDEKGLEATDIIIRQNKPYFNIYNLTEKLPQTKDIGDLSNDEIVEIFKEFLCQNH